MPVIVERVGEPDLPLVVVRAGRLRAVFAPSRGGRLLALSLDSDELLWQNPDLLDAAFRPVLAVSDWPRGDGGMGTWANVGGSKTWPAPQGWDGPDSWPGPPDTVLDSGAWVVSTGVDRVVLSSAPDDRSGLRITRTFVFDRDENPLRASFEEHIRFDNVVDRSVRWSCWEVCQVDTSFGGDVVLLGTREDDVLDLGKYEGGSEVRPSPAGVRLRTGRGVTKHGAVAGSGGVAYRRPSGVGITLAATPITGADYPDGGCFTEVWLQRPTTDPIEALEGLHPDAHLAELEILGPLQRLEPGESTELSVTWTLDRLADA